MGKINGVERGRSKVELAGRTGRMGSNGVELMGLNGSMSGPNRVEWAGRTGRMESNRVERGQISRSNGSNGVELVGRMGSNRVELAVRMGSNGVEWVELARVGSD